MKLTPKDSWRSIETLVRQFPQKTAKEILEMHEHDKKCYDLWIYSKNKAKYDLVDMINAQPIYYKGRFGQDQRFFYKISDAQLIENKVYAVVEKIVVFLGATNGVVPVGEVKISREKKDFEDLDKYGLEMYEEVQQSDWLEVDAYLRGIAKFW